MSDYLTELRIGKDATLEKYFNAALLDVFAPEFIVKVENKIKGRIKFKEYATDRDEGALTRGNAIFVNTALFDKLSYRKKLKYLLHEFIHILQKSRNFFIIKAFGELDNLTRKLNAITKKYLVKPYNVFLTSKNADIGLGGKHEILAYMMNDSVDWSALSPVGRASFEEAIVKSGIFNIKSNGWKRRLKRIREGSSLWLDKN